MFIVVASSSFDNVVWKFCKVKKNDSNRRKYRDLSCSIIKFAELFINGQLTGRNDARKFYWAILRTLANCKSMKIVIFVGQYCNNRNGGTYLLPISFKANVYLIVNAQLCGNFSFYVILFSLILFRLLNNCFAKNKSSILRCSCRFNPSNILCLNYLNRSLSRKLNSALPLWPPLTSQPHYRL